MSTHPLEEILHPQSIAVAGASDNPGSSGYGFTYHLIEYGYRGKIYPVNPRYPEILGMKAYPTIRDIPGPVDYVISAVPAAAVPNMLADCSQKGVKAVHLFTGRFSETGRQDAAELEQVILKQARKAGIRLIGPNCLGLYHPREGIAFGYDFPKEPGAVGLAAQSGGGALNFVYLASLRGVRFSKVISYGNALDLNECDFLDYFSQDAETKLIVMYIEGVRDSKRFFASLRQAAATKPVIILKGGRGQSGMRAAASHTAALAGSMKVWESLVAQAGAISAQDFDEMADLAVSFYFLPPVQGPRVGVVGGGGGPSVLAADQCEEAGLDVIPLPEEIREELKSQGISIWDWVGNPADSSIAGEASFSAGDMLRMMDRNQNFDILIGIIGEGSPGGKESIIARRKGDVKSFIKVKKEISKPLLVMVEEKSLGIKNHNHWRWRVMSEARTKLIAANIPVYPTMARAARAARKLVEYYRRRK
ncbi:MAG: CoA-binding protein [Chloroflexi bacterium]|nr:CoA-binding protein [Chloroflexota bacterium]